jgi:carboxypeptidase C (cathepsin A)
MYKTLTTAAVLGVASAAHTPDLIQSLPGWSGPLPTNQYSGYLNVSSTHLHYWFVEAENSPQDAPVVLWLNGGPGCSSLDGFFYEHGPFEVDVNDYSKLVEREYRWNKNVNMLYVESPVGVGFSYSDTDDYKCTDDRTATENRKAIEAFYSMFPEYKTNKFYITGESYGGIYVPTLAEAILNGEQDGTYTGAHLNGIAVGNGCTGTEIGICGSGPQGIAYEWEYLVSTSFVDTDLKNKINAACDWRAAEQNEEGSLSLPCISLLNEASLEIENVNTYNIYGDCVSSMCKAYGTEEAPRNKIPDREPYVVKHENGKDEVSFSRILESRGPAACIDSAAASGYLNNPEVMDAIHVRNPGFCWAVCNTAKGWSYSKTRKNLPRDTYPALVANMDVVIYNGDWDACVPYTDNEAWTENMGFSKITPWHAWSYTSPAGNANQVAGYAVNYDVSSLGSGSFQFITIKGGRHEVPETAPGQALEMLDRVVNGKAF